jgi:ABC-type transport system involved in Fe-S cluster assembly fused permease/ATPase subunit
MLCVSLVHFVSEEHEELRYDAALKRYSHANIRTQQTLAVLNAGQQLIIVAGVAGVMILVSPVTRTKENVADHERVKQLMHAMLTALCDHHRLRSSS